MDNLFKGAFKNKTVLVTGHTGFKGSWLSIWLNEMGANVIGYSLSPYTDKDNFVLANLDDKMESIYGDIRDFEKLNQAFNYYKPEIVFHLAAQPLVRYSYQLPRETYEQNIMGTVNILECVRNSSYVKACVLITTDKCYENKEWVWGYRETDRLGGFDPYSSSKAACEIVASAYRNSFFSNANGNKSGIATVRAGNVIGGGDWSTDRIIPDCIKALENNMPIKVRNPKATRPWQHVLEPLSGYLLLASKILSKKDNYSDGWNFGPDHHSIVKVKEVVEIVLKCWGTGSWEDMSKGSSTSLHEANLLSLDCSKAKSILGWHPHLTLEEALQMTVDWYKNYQNGNVYEKCVEQINAYCMKLKEE
ncbi:UNVERIFIED_CONTAM: CDP-glucose 4,6-dehydratase [Acetivibrio alkalicellulosi]